MTRSKRAVAALFAWRSTIGARLTLAYAAALLAGLAAFAGIALFLIDRTQHDGLDRSLETDAAAVAAIVDVRKGRLHVDPDDRVRIESILGGRANGAVLDRAGYAIFASGDVAASAVSSAALQSHPAPSAQTLHTPSGDVRVLVRPMPLDKPLGAIVLWHALAPLGDLDRRIAIAFGLLILPFVAFAIFFGAAIAARVLAPLRDLARLASEIEASDFSRRLERSPSPDELGLLCETFDRMLDRLQAAFERERRFAADASHEFRAPLSIIIAEVDLALRRERSLDEYRRALQSIADEAAALDALSSDLLAAARGYRTASATLVDLSAVAVLAASRVEPLTLARGLTIERSIAPSAWVIGDPAELGRMVIALLHNALRYARENGTVELTVEMGSDNSVALAVRDDGDGFSAAALSHALERFWRDDSARGRSGTGLGLTIVRGIAEACGGTVQLANRSSGGAEVRITLPGAPQPAKLVSQT